jgi:hypothetical protein
MFQQKHYSSQIYKDMDVAKYNHENNKHRDLKYTLIIFSFRENWVKAFKDEHLSSLAIKYLHEMIVLLKKQVDQFDHFVVYNYD